MKAITKWLTNANIMLCNILHGICTYRTKNLFLWLTAILLIFPFRYALASSNQMLELNDMGEMTRSFATALNSNNHPVISYHGPVKRDLILPICTDELCTNPTLTTVDNSGGVGLYLSVALNSPPILDLNGTEVGLNYSTTFIEEGGAVPIVALHSLTVSDTDNITLTAAAITITNLLDDGAEVLNVDTTNTNITDSYDKNTGLLTMTGPDTVANFQKVLRTATYNNTAIKPSPSSRILALTVNDGISNSSVAFTHLNIERNEYEVYLPFIQKPDLRCPVLPVLTSPSNNEKVDTLIPSLSWNSGNNSRVTQAQLEVIYPDNTDTSESEFWKSGIVNTNPFDQNLEKDQVYRWRVRLQCGDVWGDFSPEWQFTPVYDGPFLPGPQLVSPLDDSTTDSVEVTVQWEAVPGAKSYIVFGKGGFIPIFYPRAWTFNTQAVLDQLDEDTTYLWYVVAKGDKAFGQQSETWVFTTPVQ